ncbi:hypothetical protein NW762_003194 [Fusarium torreyae]|uniref:Uncharacterized protein n=1 Tax=Fusarium torreyae TaxID=1237075 RepID=A0A9W8VIP0_9HYPO|nr:hypothetical protein NW762_003194 [Fusarium torreyae]
MARKRSKRPRRAAKSKPRNPQFWKNTERLHILAYLNWCVQYGERCLPTAACYMKKATGREFSERQIRDKLHREWEKWGKCDEFNDLFDQGTAGFEPLREEDRQLFQHILAGMDPPREDESELSTVPSPEGSDIELNLTPTIPDSEDEMSLDNPEPLQDPVTEPILREVEAELLKQKGYVFTLRNRLSEVQREVEDLRHCDRAANSEQFDLRQQISKLKSKLEAKKRLARDLQRWKLTA